LRRLRRVSLVGVHGVHFENGSHGLVREAPHVAEVVMGFLGVDADDLLDAQGDAEAVGKAVAKDAARGKATLVALMGVEAAKTRLGVLLQEAEAALAPFGDRAITLLDTVRFAVNRKR